MVRNNFRSETILTSKLDLFGKNLKFALDTEISNSNNDEYREHLADFNRKPAYLYCYYGDNLIARTKLVSREDKHLLLNNSKTEVIEEQKKHINITNCFKLFDGIVFRFDLSKNMFGYTSDPRSVDVLICPSALGYVANGKLLKYGLDERSIVWAFCEETEDSTKDHIISRDGKIYRFKTVPLELQRERCISKLIQVYKEFGSNWEKYNAKFGGTELRVKSSTRYALNGLLCGSEDITIGLINQNKNSLNNYVFRDATSEEEKINQIININRRPKFLKDDNENAIVVGFSDSYLDKRVKERFTDDFLKI